MGNAYVHILIQYVLFGLRASSFLLVRWLVLSSHFFFFLPKKTFTVTFSFCRRPCLPVCPCFLFSVSLFASLANPSCIVSSLLSVRSILPYVGSRSVRWILRPLASLIQFYSCSFPFLSFLYNPFPFVGLLLWLCPRSWLDCFVMFFT